MNHDTSRSAIEYGPDGHIVEMPCQRDGCEDGQIPAGTFAPKATKDCDECAGEGVIYIDPDDWADDWDTRDHDVQKGNW